jgi:hypothetical protein
MQSGVAAVGGFRYRSLSQPLRILEWLIIIGVVDAGVQWFLTSFRIHNLWTMHFYTLIELMFVVMIYSSWMKQRRSQLVLSLCLAGFTILWIVSKFSFEPFSLADDGTAAISKILQIAFSAYLLLDIVKENEIVWTNDPRFWVATGTIIYSAESLFLFALFNRMLQISTERFLMIWPLNWVFMIISNLLFLRAFLCKK